MSSPLSSASTNPATIEGICYQIKTYEWKATSFSPLFRHQEKYINEIAVSGIVFNSEGTVFYGEPRDFE